MKFKYKLINDNLGFGNDMLKNILHSRGITDVTSFLNLGEHNIEDFHLYDNIQVGVNCIDKHIKNKSRIVILVDFDFDGFSSGAEMYLYLQQLKQMFNLEFTLDYIIHSKKAHGLTKEVMLKLEQGNYNLVIVPDAGSNNFKEHEILYDNKVDVLVLDHHICEKYSEHAIIINNQLSSKVTNKSLTGVGVVYKFNKALDEYYNIELADYYLDLVAVGMIADYCDVTNLESRYLILKGLELIQNKENNNKLISKVFEKKSYSMNNKVTINNVAFYMCPLINCIIRGGDYETKVILFKAFIGETETIKDKIRGRGEVELSLEDYIIRKYDKLKKIQDKESTQGVDLLSKQIEDYNLYKQEIMVVNGSDIKNNTYNRIIVNGLSSKYKKHCILLKNYNGFLKGSASGCKNKEISDLRTWCDNTGLFEFAEGHNMAFGVNIKYENINKLYEIVSNLESEDTLTYNVDGVFTNGVSGTLVKEIAKYKDIWGNGLSEPLFAMENIIINTSDLNIIQKTNITLKFKHKGVEFIKFKMTDDELERLVANKQNKFKIVGRFDMNTYHGFKTPQVIIEDFEFEKSNRELNPFLK